MVNLDLIFQFFLGDEPDSLLDPIPYNLYYVSKMIIGIYMAFLIGSLFKWMTNLIMGRR